MYKTLRISTQSNCQLIDISDEIRRAVQEAEVLSGIVTIFVPHTTAGVTINENADPDVVCDLINALYKLYPNDNIYRHFEGNTPAHLKASAMGSSCQVLVENGQIQLGTWQGIYFCEFDGPRSRKYFVKVVRD